jgi:hypothetical protein
MTNVVKGTIARTALAVAIILCAQARGGEEEQRALAQQSAEQLLQQSREAYTIFDRAALSQALATKSMAALPQLSEALGHAHWHVRHCALMTIKALAKTPEYRPALKSLVPELGELVTRDPSLGVRIEAAECLGAMAEQGKGAQQELAKAAVEDQEDWVRMAAAAALNAVQADPPVMMKAYEALIRSTDKISRAEGINKAAALLAQKIDITPLIPALKDVFLKPIYDANFSGQTRAPALNLLLRLKVDLSDLTPAISRDLATVWKTQNDGYHPYQKITLNLLGQLGVYGEPAIPVLEAVIADPSKFGCTRDHPDYGVFISNAQESIKKIRAAIASKGARQ